ncbi:MAG: 3-dehydroquinate synthase [Phycisphaerales bacterium]|nr:3-dehydroquinate synthase [Phycisphaerales bacterium]
MSARKSVHVNISGAPYDVLIQSGLLGSVGAELVERTGCTSAALVVQRGLPEVHVSRLVSSFPPGFALMRYDLPPGEENKSLERVREAYDVFLAARISRGTPLIAFGGGVTGDVAGFVAATILRGVPLVMVPTTLLAMVDSCVGGKVGVNHGAYKNMIGAFKQPMVVFCDPETLLTLPARELSNGLAECIKHAVIRDPRLFEQMERELPRALSGDIEYLSSLIEANVAIKARIVERDVFERGERAHLNFGHTFGHAIETVSRHEYSHGEAIALGMCAAGYVARELGLLSEADRGRIVRLLSRAGLPATGLDLDDTVIYSAMLHDKKVAGGKIRLVLPEGIGRAVVRDDVPRALILEAINSLRSP